MLGMVLAPLWPAYGEAIARGDEQWVRRTLKRSLIMAVGIAAVLSALLVLFGDRIISVWVGHAVNPPLALLMGLGVWKVIEAGGNALAVFLNGAHVVRLQVILALITAVTSIVLKVVLVREIGAAGVVWASAIAFVSCTAIPTAFFMRKVLQGIGIRA
jgi:O-antigen/teichoic acid export membrane protein